MKYLVVRRASVRGATAVASSAFITPPGPLPALGWSHAVARALGVSVTGVAMIHHGSEFRAESERPGAYSRGPAFHQFRAASFIDQKDYSSTNRHALSLQPTARCDLELSLIVEMDEDAHPDLEHATELVETGRFAGGRFDGKAHVALHEELDAAVRTTGGGFALHDRTDLLRGNSGHDPLDRLLAWLDPNRDRRVEPWLLPATLGYRTITPIASRAGAREGLPHAFVESLVGLVQYRNAWSETPSFWRYDRPSHDTFLATTLPENDA